MKKHIKLPVLIYIINNGSNLQLQGVDAIKRKFVIFLIKLLNKPNFGKRKFSQFPKKGRGKR